MKYRAALMMSAILLLAAGLFLWLPLGSSPGGAPPAIAPRSVPQPVASAVTHSFGTAKAIPKDLSDQSFWKMISEFSEPDGYFIYENFLSNEKSYQDPIPSLKDAVRPGGVYLGVGPEQNFTYIAAIQPQMAFIIDIRRQNMIELLMYKALFEIASNRADFVSDLFSRKRPDGLNEKSTAEELFYAYAGIQPDRRLFDKNLSEIKVRLAKHGFALSETDENTIAYVYNVFFIAGPNLTYSSVSPGPAGPSYESLMTLRDRKGRNWSYLAAEDNFAFVKEMQRKNLIVPLVGDFAGPKTIRTVGSYLKDQHAAVSAFYLSNVEMYILPSHQWKSYCANVATLPIDSSSTFIRFILPAYAGSFSSFGFRGVAAASRISPMIDVLTGVTKGYPPSYYDLLHASK